MKITNNNDERLIKNTFETTKFHRYFYVVFFSFISFHLQSLETRNLYFLSILLFALVTLNIFVLITNNKFFILIADFPLKLMTRLLDISGALLLSIFYFFILTPFSFIRKKSKNYNFLNKMWVDVERSEIDFENGF